MTLLETKEHSNEYKSLSSLSEGPKPTKADDQLLAASLSVHNEANQPPKWHTDYRNYLKILVILIIIAFIVIAIIYSKTTSRIFNAFLKWMQNNAVIGSFAFIALYWCCTVMMIPGSILTLGAGFGTFLY